MSRLITFGCSHTFGQALPDVWNNIRSGPSKYAWPQLLADKLNIECVNLGIPGASNKQIWFRIVKIKFEPNDIVIILWSSQPRWCIIRKLEPTSWSEYTFKTDLISKHDPIDFDPSYIDKIAPYRINKHDLIDFDSSVAAGKYASRWEGNTHKPSEYFLKYIYDKNDHFIDSCMRINYVSLMLKNKIKLLKNYIYNPMEFNKIPFPKWFDSNIEKADFQNDILAIYSKAIDDSHVGEEGHKAFADILYKDLC